MAVLMESVLTVAGKDSSDTVSSLIPIEDIDTDELVRRVSRMIRRETNLGIQEMKVGFEEQKLVISGYCRTFYTKQLAQQAVLAEIGEVELVNRIRVV